MEKSTQGVVEGAKLSDAAGDALNEIREVSGQLAELIQKISDATRTQSTLAGKMLQNVKTILAVTEKTSKDTQRTNESIEYLATLATDLRQSVSGFKL
jgi:twitching motility protein PilJ